MANAIQSIAFGIISIVIGIIILSSLGGTIVNNTSTRSCDASAGDNVTGCALENASDTAKDMYSIMELGYPMLGIMFLFGGGYGLITGLRK